MDHTAADLTELTVVLGSPTLEHESFDDFQRRALIGEAVGEHPWALHEYAALDALMYRDGSVKTHTILETMIGSVLGADVLVLDVDRRWVRGEDGQLYTSLSVCSHDIRARESIATLSAPEFLTALNSAADTIASLDGRNWIRWSSRAWSDDALRAALGNTDVSPAEQIAGLMTRIADEVVNVGTDIGTSTSTETEAIDLASELVTAIENGRACANDESTNLSATLRALRFVEPLRTEWSSVTADAIFLGALNLSDVRARITPDAAAGLSFLYLGKRRSDDLRQSENITPRFRREILAKTFMTSYALDRLAPKLSAELFGFMCGAAQ